MRVPEAAVSQGNIIPIEAAIDPAVAALIEPFACVLRGQEAVNIRPGDYVLIFGAGPIGVMHALLARMRGAGRVVVSEILPERAEKIAQLGVDRVVNPLRENLLSIVREESNGDGADVVIVAVPAPEVQESAPELAGIRGRINFFGGLPKDKPFIRFNSNLVHYKELIVTGTTACSTNDCHRAAELVVSGRIDLSPLVSANFPLSLVRQAFQAAEDRKSLKVMLEP
jgi:L-iditol 2-dehydrogenase